MKNRWPCHTPLGRTWTLPAIIHEHYVVFTQLLGWWAEQQSSASNRKGDNSLYKSSSACTQSLLEVNVAIGWVHKNWQQVMQPWGEGGCQKVGRGRAIPPSTCKGSTWLSCAFTQRNQMPFSSLILSLITFHSFYRDKALQSWASKVSWCSKIRKGMEGHQGQEE